jgi:CRISPR-associated protein Csb1
MVCYKTQALECVSLTAEQREATLEQVLDRLAAATSLESEDVAIRIDASYQPQAGPQAKVFPPTYLETGGSRYHTEQRWTSDGEAADVVVLDSIQSQANRAEQALLGDIEALGLPQILLRTEVDDRQVTISTLEAPHRSRDAYFIDSLHNGTRFDKTEVGAALLRSDADHATAYLRHAPCDLIYGVWDSHRGRRVPTKFPRVVTSEMLGWHVLHGRRAATKDDPLNLPGEDRVDHKELRPGMVTKQAKKAEVEFNELGYGMIPGQPDPASGGVAVRTITRTAVISLTGLSRLRFPVDGGHADAEGRVALAALALLADRLAFARAGLNLRSGSDLVCEHDQVSWVTAGGETEPWDVNVASARELFDAAKAQLARTGIAWDPAPVELRPVDKLQQEIERTFHVPDPDPEG